MLSAKDVCLWTVERQARQFARDSQEITARRAQVAAALNRCSEELTFSCYFCGGRFFRDQREHTLQGKPGGTRCALRFPGPLTHLVRRCALLGAAQRGSAAIVRWHISCERRLLHACIRVTTQDFCREDDEWPKWQCFFTGVERKRPGGAVSKMSRSQ